MPLDKDGYHTNFKIRGAECINRANNTCQNCGRKQGEEYTAEDGKVKKVILQAAHVNHDPWNPKAELRSLCKSCHLKYDGPVHGKNMKRTKKRIGYHAELGAGQQLLSFKNKKSKGPKAMPARLDTEIRYNEENGSYLIFDTEDGKKVSKDIVPNSPKYYAWLDQLKSFHFSGKYGSFTTRHETRKNKGTTVRREMYWSAYRKHDHKQLRRYIGITGALSIKALENTAKYLTDQCLQQEPMPKKPRRRPVHRDVLLARIEQLEAENQRLRDEIQTSKGENQPLLAQ